MFTGIVEELGVVKSITRGPKSMKITICGNKIFEDLKIGDSVATNGLCLTAAEIRDKEFSANVMNQTLKNSSMGDLKVGESVNLERAIAANGRFGGHIVSGHIDGKGTIGSIRRDGVAILYNIRTSDEIMRGIVEKGSITVDGISLTVAGLYGNSFTVSIIPHTLDETVLGKKRVGSNVNLEKDILGKYVEKILSGGKNLGGKYVSIQ